MNYSLLIVESDLDQLELQTRWFSRIGCHVTAVHHPRQALAAATMHPFRVALVNHNLLEIDGIELTRRLCSLLPDVRVIVLSCDIDTAANAKQAGAFACLVKPYTKADLEEAVEDAFEQYAEEDSGPARPNVAVLR